MKITEDLIKVGEKESRGGDTENRENCPEGFTEAALPCRGSEIAAGFLIDRQPSSSEIGDISARIGTSGRPHQMLNDTPESVVHHEAQNGSRWDYRILTGLAVIFIGYVAVRIWGKYDFLLRLGGSLRGSSRKSCDWMRKRSAVFRRTASGVPFGRGMGRHHLKKYALVAREPWRPYPKAPLITPEDKRIALSRIVVPTRSNKAAGGGGQDERAAMLLIFRDNHIAPVNATTPVARLYVLPETLTSPPDGATLTVYCPVFITRHRFLAIPHHARRPRHQKTHRPHRSGLCR